MTTSAVTTLAAHTPLTDAEIRNETANGLAADLLERALQGPVDMLHITLVQIADSGLIDKEHNHRRYLDELCRDGEDLTSRLSHFFPACSHGGARPLMKKCQTLSEQVSLYRQEQFWLRSEPAALVQSEALIRDVFEFYHEADYLMRSIDQEQPCDRVERRAMAPQRTPNPYEAIDHD